MANFVFRAAVKSDCLDIAKLYRLSSDGVAEYTWRKMALPGEDILTIGQRRYEREDTNFSYENCVIVDNTESGTKQSSVVAMLVTFPMHVDPDCVEPDPVLEPFSVLEEDNSYYVCGVAVKECFRGLGIGKKLMARAESDAQRLNYDKLSLLVFEQNTGALRLYQRLGYKEVARRTVVPHPLLHYSGDVLLLVKQLSDSK